MDMEHNIKRIREERGYTQKQLGRMLRKPESVIQFYEDGRFTPCASTILHLSKALNVGFPEITGTNKLNITGGELFGKRLKDLRISNNIAVSDFCRVFGIAIRDYENYEYGFQPDEADLFAIADYYCVSLDYLLGRSNIKRFY